jgi:transcriptional regulator with XRE-family HTH domain
MPHVAANIRAARKAAGLTQERLARELDVTSSTVANWERGQSWPSHRSNLSRLAGVLGREPVWFFTEHDQDAEQAA